MRSATFMRLAKVHDISSERVAKNTELQVSAIPRHIAMDFEVGKTAPTLLGLGVVSTIVVAFATLKHE